jgi:nucleoside-diphosphate-sugar epimerase
LAKIQKTRDAEVAHIINEHLPESYQNSILQECQRVSRDILAPRGIEQRKILIVGGAGYIGSVVTEHLLACGYAVRSFDLQIYGHGLTIVPFLNHPNYQYIYGDIVDTAAISAALEGITDVVLLAGLVGDPITKEYPNESEKINEIGYDILLEALNGRGLNKVVFVSTCSNYGLVEGDQLADENFELNPLSLYAKAKVKVEKKLLSLEHEVNYTGTVLRFATAFGLSPRMRFDLTISQFARSMFLSEDLLVFDAQTWRPYCHVRDFAEVIRRVLEAPSETVAFDVFNAGGDVNNYTKKMIVDAIIEQLPQSTVRFQEHGADPRNYKVDFSKIREKLYFEPTYSVPDGISELLAAFNQGLFRDISQPSSYYGNWKIDYAGMKNSHNS